MAYDAEKHLAETAHIVAKTLLHAMFRELRVYLTPEQLDDELDVHLAGSLTLACALVSMVDAPPGLLTIERARELITLLHAKTRREHTFDYSCDSDSPYVYETGALRYCS